MREPQDVRSPLVVRADRRDVMIGRAERVGDHGRPDRAAGLGFEADRAPVATEAMDHGRIIRVGDRAVGIRELREVLPAHQGRGMPAGLLVPGDIRVALGALRLAGIGARLRLHPMLGPIRAGQAEGRRRLGDVPRLQGGPAPQPGRFAVGTGSEDRVEPAERPRPAFPSATAPGPASCGNRPGPSGRAGRLPVVPGRGRGSPRPRPGLPARIGGRPTSARPGAPIPAGGPAARPAGPPRPAGCPRHRPGPGCPASRRDRRPAPGPSPTSARADPA